MNTIIYKADAHTVAALEGVTKDRAYIIIKEAKAKAKKPASFMLSVYEYCQAQGLDYDKVMIDVRAGKLRRQAIQAKDIARLLNVTVRTGFNYLEKIRKHYNYPSNTCVLFRDFAAFAGIDVEELYQMKELYNS